MAKKMTNEMNVLGLGLALGIAIGVYVWFIGMMAMLFGWGATVVDVLGSLYSGYGPSFFGSIVGLIWGFIDGFIGGVVIAWLYNKFAK